MRQALLLMVLCICLPSLTQEAGQSDPVMSPAINEFAVAQSSPMSDDSATTAAPIPDTPSDPRKMAISIDADRFLLQENGVAEFFGNVELTAPQATIRADHVRYEDRTRTVTATGNVTIAIKDDVSYRGESLEYRLTAPNQWQFREFSTEYPPEMLGYPFLEPLFARGERAEGDRSGSITIHQGHATTCDLARPHYEFVSRRIIIYPGDKLIARDTDLYVLGKRVVRLPYLFIFLRERQYPVTPEIGQTMEDGYFARFFYQYQLSDRHVGVMRLDVTEKRGQGIGVRHRYQLSDGSGELFAFLRNKDDEYTLQLKHQQQLPARIHADLSFDIKQNSVFTLQKTTSTNINLNFARDDDSLSFTRYVNAGQFRSDTVSAVLRYNFPLAAGTVSGNTRYSSFGRNAGGEVIHADQEMWNYLQWTRPFAAGNVQVLFNHRTDVDGDRYLLDNQNAGTQQLPEISFISNSEKLQWHFLNPVQTSFTLGWGVFDELSGGKQKRLGRTRLEVNTRVPEIKLGNTTLDGNAYLFQTVYGDRDTTAQYSVDGNLRARTILGALRNEVSYRRNIVEGFTPFFFDTRYPSHSITDNVIYERGDPADPRHYYTARLSSGRDLLNKRWRDVTLVTRMPAGADIIMTHQLGYDPNTRQWRDWTSGYSWTPNERLVVNLGTRYNIEEHRLSRIAGEIDWVLNSQWRVQHRASLDTATGVFNYNELLLTRDLHCWDATLFVSDTHQTVGLFLRLKALDIPIPSFGIGRGGEVLDATLGASGW